MEAKIKKLIKKYEQKITKTEKNIEAELKIKRVARYSNNQSLLDLSNEKIKVFNAKKQAYIQAKADIDSLLD